MRAAPSTTLAVDPADTTKTKGDSFILQITINTGTNSVVAADLDINFNPLVLEVTDISLGIFFSSPTEARKTIDNTTGNILYALTSFTARSGSGNLASILFEAKDVGTSSISFGSRTGVYASGGENVLQQTSPGTVTITEAATPTPTPTSGPTATPTPTSPPGATPTPTPTLPPGGTPTPTPIPTLTPSPTPTPSPGTGGPTTSITTATTIISPPSGATVTTSKPTISGKTVPGAMVTITINSQTITGSTTADSAGNWSYTPTTSLADGTHTVTITAKDPNTGQTVSKTSSFIIATGGGQVATTASEIVAGNSLPTLILLGAGLLLIILGLTPRLAKLTIK